MAALPDPIPHGRAPDMRDQALIAANLRIMQLERALVRLIDAHDAPEPVRAKAIQDALFVGRGLTF